MGTGKQLIDLDGGSILSLARAGGGQGKALAKVSGLVEQNFRCTLNRPFPLLRDPALLRMRFDGP